MADLLRKEGCVIEVIDRDAISAKARALYAPNGKDGKFLSIE